MSCYLIHYSKRPGRYTRPNLSFKHHISYVTRKAFSTLETLLSYCFWCRTVSSCIHDLSK